MGEPAANVAHVMALRSACKQIAMGGDGINDAPALSELVEGIGLGTGADAAKQSAGTTFLGGDLRGIATAFRLSRASTGYIR